MSKFLVKFGVGNTKYESCFDTKEEAVKAIDEMDISVVQEDHCRTYAPDRHRTIVTVNMVVIHDEEDWEYELYE